MIKPITSENLYLLLPGKTTQMALLYSKEKNISILDAIRAIYNSNTYKELEDESSKLWHLGPVALVECLNENG